MKARYVLAVVAVLGLTGAETSCDSQPSSDHTQQEQQERILKEGRSQVGMPAIVNFRELKLLKEIYELRDQASFVTYTYLWNEFNGKLVFFCQSIGYPIPYSTQFTAPGKPFGSDYHALTTVPQADPNGLFSPPSAEGTWVLCKNPKGDDVRPIYAEPRIVTSPFKLEP